MPLQPWTVRASRTLLDRWPWLRVREQHVVLPNGTEIPDFLALETRDFAMVCAFTPDERVVMIELFRMSVRDVCYELPAGGLDALDEDPLACARRELLEETGYVALDWAKTGAWMVDSNRGLCRAHLFLARGAEHVAEPRFDETEDIRVHLVDLPTLRAWLSDGHIRTLPTVAASGMALERRAR